VTAPEPDEYDQWVETNPLRRWRHERGYSYMKACALIGVSMTVMQMWERGVNPPNPANMHRLNTVVGKGTDVAWARWLERKP